MSSDTITIAPTFDWLFDGYLKIKHVFLESRCLSIKSVLDLLVYMLRPTCYQSVRGDDRPNNRTAVLISDISPYSAAVL